MNVCIISGRYPNTVFDSAINHKIYADQFGYDYIHCNWPTKERNAYLNKIHYILTYLESYDYIIWIDDDAFFFDFDIDIMQYAPNDGKFLSICKSPTFKTLKTYFSSGQFILKSSLQAKQFLKQVLLQDLKIVKNWWREDLGYFSNGDQDAMVYLLQTIPEYAQAYKLYDYRLFNSRIENVFGQDEHKPLVLHFTGTVKVKEKNYERVQNELGLHRSLVPKEKLASYNISSMNVKKNSLIRKLKKYFFV